MRNEIEGIIKEKLRSLALHERGRSELTQAKMAESLLMQTRSYAYIESGKFMCGTLTALLLLLRAPDRDAIFDELEKAVNGLTDKAKD